MDVAPTDQHDERHARTPPARTRAHGAIGRRCGAYLPHWTAAGATYAVTFRVADSLPAAVVRSWRLERAAVVHRAAAMGRDLTRYEGRRLDELRSERIEAFLDRGHGACPMHNARIAGVVAGALAHFDGERYELLAWCVMPNHVHAVVTPHAGFELAPILHAWKSFTGTAANRLLGRAGAFWQAGYSDHLVRDGPDLARCVRYVLENPAEAGLRDWPWVGVRRGVGPEGLATDGPATEHGPEEGRATDNAPTRHGLEGRATRWR